MGLVEAGGGGIVMRSPLNYSGHSTVRQMHLPQLFVGGKRVSLPLEALTLWGCTDTGKVFPDVSKNPKDINVNNVRKQIYLRLCSFLPLESRTEMTW